MDKEKLLKNIIKSCETRFNRGDSENWKHGDFIDFSREIVKETKVNISTNTLKRIFGKISVDSYYQPQQATINALIKYSGYVFNDEDNESTIEIVSSDTILKESSVAMNMKWSLFFKVIVFILIIIGLYFLTKKEERKLASIKLVKTEGSLPKTAFFEFQLPNSKDSIFIDFGDKSSSVYMIPEQNKISHAYLFPGVFNVTIKNKNNDLAKTKIYVPSNKWLGLGFFRQHEIPNRYYAFPIQKYGKDSLFHIPNSQLQRVGLDTLQSYFTRLCNFTPKNNYSDSFVFETTFKKEVSKKGVYCNSMRFQITGIENFIRFNFVSSGCSSSVLNVISEESFDGSKVDLSKFVLDLDKWNTVKLINRNKNLSLYVNSKLLLQTKYVKTIGDLRGVFVEFSGNGYVKKCSLKSFEGENLYDF